MSNNNSHNESFIQPQTPPRLQVPRLPFTPTTPNDDFNNTESSNIDETILRNHSLKVSSNGKSSTAKTPKKSAPVFTGANSLITPDFTPKLRKRKDLFDSLAATSNSNHYQGIIYEEGSTTDDDKTSLHPQPTTVGSGRSHSLMKAPEVSPRKRQVANPIQIQHHKLGTGVISSDEEEFSNSESPTKSNFGNLKNTIRESLYSNEPSTPPQRSTRINVQTPSSRILKTKGFLQDEFEPHDTLSSPSIHHHKAQYLPIFKTKERGKLFITPENSDRESDADSEYHDTDTDSELVEFNPHKEVLLINKQGDKIIKQFDPSDKFNQRFRPKNLLNNLLSAQEPSYTRDEATLRQKEVEDDEFVRMLLAEEGESSDEEYFRKSVVKRTTNRSIFASSSSSSKARAARLKLSSAFGPDAGSFSKKASCMSAKVPVFKD